MSEYFSVFEHQSIKLNDEIDGVVFDSGKLKALQSFYGEKGVPYFNLIHKGVCFKEFVGVIQVGETVIEVLPKADSLSNSLNEKNRWRDILINMLFSVGIFDIHSPSNSDLKLKSNSILDIYFELFIAEVEYLLHSGLIKKYRKNEGNVTALKGNILFGKQIQKNIIHRERFYVRYSTYDYEHILHSILYKTINLLKQINTRVELHSRIGALLLNFPEMPAIKISERTFEKLIFSRKTKHYKKAIDISRLLLLKYHPDLIKGRNNVLALMFDMNKLWENFVYASIRKYKKEQMTITAQTSKYFWKPQAGSRTKIRPDIVINKAKTDCVVLDTKWKKIKEKNPSLEDLRQLYVYHDYYNAKKVALIYPGDETTKSKGKFLDPATGKETGKECSVISFTVESRIKDWQKNIFDFFYDWWKNDNNN